MSRTDSTDPLAALGAEYGTETEIDTGQWQLRLYVAGQSPKSLKAYANLVALCEEQLDPRYEIEIVDLVKQPQLAAGDEIVAIPTLVRHLPLPMRKIIGDLSDSDRVLVGLQLRLRGS